MRPMDASPLGDKNPFLYQCRPVYRGWLKQSELFGYSSKNWVGNPVLLGRLYSSPRVVSQKLAIRWLCILTQAFSCIKVVQEDSEIFEYLRHLQHACRMSRV